MIPWLISVYVVCYVLSIGAVFAHVRPFAFAVAQLCFFLFLFLSLVLSIHPCVYLVYVYKYVCLFTFFLNLQNFARIFYDHFPVL